MTTILILLSSICYSQELEDLPLDSLTKKYYELTDDEDKLKVLDKICLIHYNVDSTYKYAEIEYNLAVKLQNTKYQFYALDIMSWSEFYRGSYTKSIALCFKSLGLCEKLDGTNHIAPIYMILSFNYYCLGDFYYADEFCRKALTIYDENENHEYVAFTNKMIGLYCTEYHFFEIAREHLNLAMKIDKENSFEGISEDYLELGYCDFVEYCVKGNDSLLISAINLYSKSYENNQKNKIEFETSDLYTKYISAYLELAKISKGEARQNYIDSCHKYNNLSEELTTKLGLSEDKFASELAITECFILENNKKETEAKIKEITELIKESPEREKRFGEKYYNLMILYYKSTNDYKNILDNIQKLRVYNLEHYNFDLGNKITKIEEKERFEQYLNLVEQRSKQRDEEFEQDYKENRIINIFLSIIVAIVIITIVFAKINVNKITLINRKLRLQSYDIGCQIIELKKQNLEFEELEKKFENEKQELYIQKRKFIKANRYLIYSLSRAWEIQTSLIPSREIMEKIFGECLIYWKPLQTVSGDFYWAQQTANLKILVTADCTGHGVPGAFMSMLGISTLNDIVTNRDLNNEKSLASDILEDMRSKIIKSLHQNSEDNEQYDAIDMSVCLINKNKNVLQFAGANRPLWIAGKDGIKDLEPDEISTGIDLMGFQNFTNKKVEYCEGEILYTFSDGITDQFGGKNGKMKFGSKRLKLLLKEISNLNFEKQYEKIQEATYDWTTQTFENEDFVEIYRPQLDDQLLIGIKV